MEDFRQAIKNVKPSASLKYLKQFEEWTEKHSSI